MKETYSDEQLEIKYIITCRLNQDLLEHFFSFIRATGGAYDHPTALDFKYRLKRYIVGKYSANLFCGSSNIIAGEPNIACLSSPLTDNSSSKNLSSMLEPFITEEEETIFAEELFANTEDVNVNVDNYPLCDLSNYNMSIEEEEMLLLLENLNIVDIIR